MIQLAENFDFTNSSDWKAFHLIFQAYFLQCNKIPYKYHIQQIHLFFTTAVKMVKQVGCLLSIELRVCYRYAKHVLAGLISGTGPGSNPGWGAKLGQALMLWD